MIIIIIKKFNSTIIAVNLTYNVVTLVQLLNLHKVDRRGTGLQ